MRKGRSTGGRDLDDARRIYDTQAERFVAKEDTNPDRKMIYDVVVSMLGNVRRKNILDAGCGAGRDAAMLAKAGARVTGIDISPKMLWMARKRCANRPTDLWLLDMQCTAFPAAKFDAIISVFSAPYAKDLEGLIKEFRRLLKRGGVLVMVVPHPVRKMVKYTGDYFETGKHWEIWENGMRTFNYYRTTAEHMNTLVRCGFALEEMRELKTLRKAEERMKYPYYLAINAKTV